ncbi:uncharacterized protein LOC143348755 [Colletes latitarsis]|uniref:uncharacterized protein LOC143348755 n=1 Tax=Colletes latitarsis TaxID=2605962 RepID=UPI0040360A6A
MLNFYRRFIPRAAQVQAPLNDLLKDNVKGRALVTWTPGSIAAFEASKRTLAEAALLAHPRSDAPLALTCDASDFSVGAVLQQRTDSGWEPLGFFSKKLTDAEGKYGAYDRELLAIYLGIKHFRHMVEGRVFTIYTDHKPITFAFRQKPEKCTPRQFRYLDLIGQFSTDIQHLAGKDNVVAEALSRIEEVNGLLDYDDLGRAQETDEELQRHLGELTGTSHLRTTAYHPAANGMVERLHRQMKAAIRCHQQAQWTKVLPTILLGIRAAWREDVKATAAELVYGETLRLPGEFLSPRPAATDTDVADFAQELREQFRELAPAPVTRHGARKTFIFKDLGVAEQVFVRNDKVRSLLQPPYDGPYTVVSRGPKTFVINIKNKPVTITVDRLKPAYTMSDATEGDTTPSSQTT